jgi:hypothetical protein
MVKEVSKLKVDPLTLDAEIVKDGLTAVSSLTDKEPYFVVGGTAVQSYLPTNCRRPTSDIDICMVRPLNYQDFLSISKPVAEQLSDSGYSVIPKKGQRAFRLEIASQYDDNLLIEFSRRNQNSFDNCQNRLERELSNSKRKIVETRDSQYVVSSSEDIIIPKLVRSIHSLMKNPSFASYLSKQEGISSDIEIKEKLKKIRLLRKRSMANKGNLEFFEELKFLSDTYDIQLLSEIVGINLGYFKEGSKEWDAIATPSPERDSFFNTIVPVPKSYQLF